jgi:hypothetical protein
MVMANTITRGGSGGNRKVFRVVEIGREGRVIPEPQAADPDACRACSERSRGERNLH